MQHILRMQDLTFIIDHIVWQAARILLEAFG